MTSRIYGQTSKKRCWDFIRQKLKEGRQLYVVSPRIEGGSDDGQQGAEQIFRELPRMNSRGSASVWCMDRWTSRSGLGRWPTFAKATCRPSSQRP